jgi:hypothetical protein
LKAEGARHRGVRGGEVFGGYVVVRREQRGGSRFGGKHLSNSLLV